MELDFGRATIGRNLELERVRVTMTPQQLLAQQGLYPYVYPQSTRSPGLSIS